MSIFYHSHVIINYYSNVYAPCNLSYHNVLNKLTNAMRNHIEIGDLMVGEHTIITMSFYQRFCWTCLMSKLEHSHVSEDNVNEKHLTWEGMVFYITGESIALHLDQVLSIHCQSQTNELFSTCKDHREWGALTPNSNVSVSLAFTQNG